MIGRSGRTGESAESPPTIQERGSLFRRIADALREWLRRSRQETVSKKFEINSTEKQGDSQRSGKTFSITGERSGGATFESRFNLGGETRPKQCPQCRVQNSVTRGSDERWRCKDCDFQWS
jgi:ribosomal protein L37AE/L43A